MAEYEPVIVRTIRGTDWSNQECSPYSEGEKQINWNDSSDRKWLMNHMHWAMMNGRKVELFATSLAPKTIV